MNYAFTDHCRQVLGSARDEALALGHDYVGTEHILLGLLRTETSRGLAALRLLGVKAYRIRETLLSAVRRGASVPARRGELPYTSRAKKVLEYAMAEVRELRHEYVGSEHLLLGLVVEEKGIAGQVLASEGVTLERAREVVRRVHADPTAAAAAQPEEDALPVAGAGAGADEVWYLRLDETSSAPIYEQIVARLEEAVATGQLEPGERLPSVRELAAELGIAPGTVARAYSELEARGVVETGGARGTRVALTPRLSREPSRDWLSVVLRRTVVAAFHRGASAQDLRDELERAMKGILHIL